MLYTVASTICVAFLAITPQTTSERVEGKDRARVATPQPSSGPYYFKCRRFGPMGRKQACNTRPKDTLSPLRAQSKNEAMEWCNGRGDPEWQDPKNDLGFGEAECTAISTSCVTCHWLGKNIAGAQGKDTGCAGGFFQRDQTSNKAADQKMCDEKCPGVSKDYPVQVQYVPCKSCMKCKVKHKRGVIVQAAGLLTQGSTGNTEYCGGGEGEILPRGSSVEEDKATCKTKCQGHEGKAYAKYVECSDGLIPSLSSSSAEDPVEETVEEPEEVPGGDPAESEEVEE